MIKAVINSEKALKEEKANVKDRDRNFYNNTFSISEKVKVDYQLDEENKDIVRTTINIYPDGEHKIISES